MMDLRKAALIATWICFWLASLALLIVNGLPLNAESGYSKTGYILITIGIIPNMCGLFWIMPFLFSGWIPQDCLLPAV